jgi:hypothetical protein
VGHRWREKAFQRLAKHLPGPTYVSHEPEREYLFFRPKLLRSRLHSYGVTCGVGRGGTPKLIVTAPLEILMPISLSDLHMEPGLAGELIENRSLPTGVRLIP